MSTEHNVQGFLSETISRVSKLLQSFLFSLNKRGICLTGVWRRHHCLSPGSGEASGVCVCICVSVCVCVGVSPHCMEAWDFRSHGEEKYSPREEEGTAETQS